MNDGSDQKHQETRQSRASRSGHKKAPARADRDHDENDLKTFKQHALERRERADGIEAFQNNTARKACNFTCENCILIVQGNNASSSQYRLAQPTHPEYQKEHANRQLEGRELNAVKKRPEC